MKTEFIRNLNSNYKRIVLDRKPEDRRYQYCILNRGGIKGLLPCTLRYMDEDAFLYYDITSMQNMRQLYENRSISREYIAEFLWQLKQLRTELERFLLEIDNIVLCPEEIFQDLETKRFCFMYVPYSEKQEGCRQLLDFWVEHIDYEDNELVDCIYKMFEQYDQLGEQYFVAKIYEDAAMLEMSKEAATAAVRIENSASAEEESSAYVAEEQKRGFFTSIFETRRKRTRDLRDEYRRQILDTENCGVVAEELFGEEQKDNSFGKTLYIEETAFGNQNNELCSQDGKTICVLNRGSITIGKRKEEAEVVLTDSSVSRLHARITFAEGNYYVEDLNSTNGTYKNGLRLQPCEKRILASGDEIRVGRVTLQFH